jgi:predicted porin
LSVDPFVGGMKGDMTAVRGWFNGAGFRINNAVTYYTPKWAGFSGSAIYGAGEVAGNNSANRNFGFSGSYGDGPVGATLAYHKTKGPATTKVRNAMLGLSAPLFSGRVMASLVRKDNRAVADADARQWALGYVYDLSKRTALYTSYAHVKNDPNAGVNAGGVNGATDKVIDFGIRHTF